MQTKNLYATIVPQTSTKEFHTSEAKENPNDQCSGEGSLHTTNHATKDIRVNHIIQTCRFIKNIGTVSYNLIVRI